MTNTHGGSANSTHSQALHIAHLREAKKSAGTLKKQGSQKESDRMRLDSTGSRRNKATETSQFDETPYNIFVEGVGQTLDPLTIGEPLTVGTKGKRLGNVNAAYMQIIPAASSSNHETTAT